jgi:nucleoside-diphosphate-sugar epimerase
MASKVVALEATETFIREKKPTFDVINIGPGCVIGRDDTVTELTDITKGTNHVAMGQLLGEPLPYALGSLVTHLDDVAKAHVEALNADITGNHFFLISAEGPGGPTWDSALEIVKRRYPKEVADGVFKMDAATETLRVRADSSYAEKTLGFKLKSYEEAVVSMVDHYLELIVRI